MVEAVVGGIGERRAFRKGGREGGRRGRHEPIDDAVDLIPEFVGDFGLFGFNQLAHDGEDVLTSWRRRGGGGEGKGGG